MGFAENLCVILSGGSAANAVEGSPVIRHTGGILRLRGLWERKRTSRTLPARRDAPFRMTQKGERIATPVTSVTGSQ